MKILIITLVIVIMAILRTCWIVKFSNISKDYIYVPVIKRSSTRFIKINVDGVPYELTDKIRAVLQKLVYVATEAEDDKEIKTYYMAQTDKISYICEELSGEIKNCLNGDGAISKYFEAMEDRLYILEDSVGSIFQGYLDIKNRYREEENDLNNAYNILELQENDILRKRNKAIIPKPFQGLEYLNKLDKSEFSTLEEKYK